ncbi:hypothetical protein C0993_001437 [Termitomyces sp. T159_Od127]|nr:hypothetical protein C0993_001437 [Termitomyces sp. T159_Od127]
MPLTSFKLTNKKLTIVPSMDRSRLDDIEKTSPSTGNETVSEYPDCDDVLPPTHEHRHRTVVLCFDGTGDQFDEDNSNVVNFFSMLKKGDSKDQLVYYQVEAHTDDSDNYFDEAGDKICIFEEHVGLLPKSNLQQVPFAYKMYCREDVLGWRQSTAFKKAFSIDVDIELLGVWETVGSVGMIPKRLPFTTSNTHVKYFRHALALDEHRVRFKPNFWNRPTPHEVNLGVRKGQMPRPKPKRQTTRDFEKAYTHGMEHATDVEEVWFAGCHCDVGGGAVRNEVRNSLARIPLRWMVRQCFLLKTGILFYKEMFKVIGMDPNSVYPVVKPRPPPVTALSTPHSAEVRYLSVIGENQTIVDVSDFVSEEEEDLADALSPINDMLRIAKTWWLLEYLPQKIKYQGDDDIWVNELMINRGHGRVIPRQQSGIKVHRSVKLRMEHGGMNYVPRAMWNKDIEPEWID